MMEGTLCIGSKFMVDPQTTISTRFIDTFEGVWDLILCNQVALLIT